MLEPALTAGFISVGMDVVLAGPLPTPAVAMLTRSLRADLGVVISASHNPYPDNGIKLFGPDGFKLSDDVERKIEAHMDNGALDKLAKPDMLGRARRLEDASGRYIEYVKKTFLDDRTLDGIKIVVDCANGAAYTVAPNVLWELGAEVVPIGIDPDGFNINQDCGSTAPAAMQEAVVTHNAQLGIALDGDADRVVMCDEKGALIDGDQLMALVAEDWRDRGILQGGGVVSTVMSNLALERHLEGLGLTMERTQVGDRYVVEKMIAGGFNVGGEQSGHLIFRDFCTTGDGLIAALQALTVFVGQDRTVSEVGRPFEPLPQELRNIRHSGGQPLDDPHVKDAVASAEARLGSEGRVLVRNSGTEPVVRVMAEGTDHALVASVLDDITGALENAQA
jgi:phosphoglucosamine mutase